MAIDCSSIGADDKIWEYLSEKLDKPPKKCREIKLFRSTTPAKLYHLTALSKVLYNEVLEPAFDLTSHRDIQVIYDLAAELDICAGLVDIAMADWTKSQSWDQMIGTDHAYMVYLRHPNAMDMTRLLAIYFPKLKEVVTAMIKVARDELGASSTEYLAVLDYFIKFDYYECANFNGFEKHVIRAGIKKLDSLWTTFLVDIHSLPADWFDYYSPVTSGENIISSPVTFVESTVGRSTIRSREAASVLFDEFTNGAFKEPMDPNLRGKITFPFDKVCICGGSIEKVLNANYDIGMSRKSDVDIFLMENCVEKRQDTVRRILEWFYFEQDGRAQTYFAILCGVICVYIVGVRRKFQIICFHRGQTPLQIMSDFDSTHIQACYHNGRFMAMPRCCLALRTKIAELNPNLHRFKIDRIGKIFSQGYSIYVPSIPAEKIAEVRDLAHNKQKMMDMFSANCTYYYPSADDKHPNFDLEKRFISANITRDSGTNVFTNNILEAVYLVQYNTSYGMSMYDMSTIDKISVDSITLNETARSTPAIKIMNDKTVLRLNTGTLTIIRKFPPPRVSDDRGMNICVNEDLAAGNFISAFGTPFIARRHEPRENYYELIFNAISIGKHGTNSNNTPHTRQHDAPMTYIAGCHREPLNYGAIEVM
jgi:hypothetical protein